MDNESPELIEQQMHETRQSLTDKVAALETQVTGTIQSATTAVQDTIDSVRTAVEDTVSSVKETVGDVKDTVESSVSSVQEGVMSAFDVKARVSESPWLMLGGATAAGFLTGLLVFRKGGGGVAGLNPFAAPMFGHASYTPTPVPAAAPPRAYAPEREEPRKPGWLDELFEMAGQEAKKLGEAALASVVASLQKNVSEGLPRLIDNALQVPDKTADGAAERRANGARSQTTR